MKNILSSKVIKYTVILAVTYGIVQLLMYLNIIDEYYQMIIAGICINTILAVSLNLVTGFTGQFSLGHAGFMAIGAYISAVITLNMEQGYSFFIGILAGAVVAAFVGFLIGIPTLRLRGDYLAIATLGFGEIIKIVILNIDQVGGAAGLSGIPQYTNWTWLFVFTAATIILIKNFIDSSHGRACISIREDEIASEAMGVNTTKYKVLAFTIGAFFAGIAGGLYSSYYYYIKPDMAGFLKSIDILVIVVLGGIGSLTGSIIAAVLLTIISAYLQSFPELRMIIYAVMLVAVMLLRAKNLTWFKKFANEKLLRKQASIDARTNQK